MVFARHGSPRNDRTAAVESDKHDAFSFSNHRHQRVKFFFWVLAAVVFAALMDRWVDRTLGLSDGITYVGAPILLLAVVYGGLRVYRRSRACGGDDTDTDQIPSTLTGESGKLGADLVSADSPVDGGG